MSVLSPAPGVAAYPSRLSASAIDASPQAAVNATMLLAGTDEQIPTYVPALRQQFRVIVTTTVSEAVAAVERERPAIIVSDLQLRDGAGTAVCTAAKRFDPPATVLVTTVDPETVPDALAAGCDGVLLRPFAPNLLYGRIGRLMRDRARDLRMRANVRPRQDSPMPRAGTNRYWPEDQCPHCRTAGVTSFEFHSHRRAWFACLECRKVWIGRRREDF